MNRKNNFRKITGKIHLILGLISGSVIMIVCLTAAIWCFSPEIEEMTQSYRHVKPSKKKFISVTNLHVLTKERFSPYGIDRLTYKDRAHTIIAESYAESHHYQLFINPYSGEILKTKDMKTDFFHQVIVGHHTLWLGVAGGHIVEISTLIFFLLIISGIILWWPRNRAARKQRYTLKFGLSAKRLNYDMHSVIGFYASWVIVFAVISGVLWSSDWPRNHEDWFTTWGELPEFPEPRPLAESGFKVNKIDEIVNDHVNNNPHGSTIINFPKSLKEVYSIQRYAHGKYYDGDIYYYDPISFEPIQTDKYGKYKNAAASELFNRVLYDVHIGNILGLPGRIMMFISVLIGASLPITGFLIWRDRNRINKRKI